MTQTAAQNKKIEPKEISTHKLAINALHHYYVTAINREGSTLTPLSENKSSDYSFFRYMAIVENNINRIVNKDKPLNKQKLQVYLDKDNLERLLNPDSSDSIWIHSRDGVVTLSPDIGAKDIETMNYYLDEEVKGLLKIALDRSYEELKRK